MSSLAAIDEAKPTIPNKNPLAVIEDETLRHKLKVRPIIRGKCHHIDCLSRWRRWKRRWRRCFARKLRRSTQRYKKETGAKNNSEYMHNILDKPAFSLEIPLVWDIKTSSCKGAESISWNFRDFEQRMVKEREALEEERQSIATRREEYLREVKEWEERLDTVGPSFFLVRLRIIMSALFSLRMSPNIFGNSA